MKTQYHQIGLSQRWTAVTDNVALLLASNHANPLSTRIFFMAMARVNLNGHAEFGPGKLIESLPIVEKKTGEIRSPSRQAINAAIKQLKKDGLIAEDSCQRCIHFMYNTVDRGQKAGVDCVFHNERPFE